METNELSCILKNMYDDAVKDKITMIILFGIKYADEIRNNGTSPKDILKAAKMPDSYATEIYKGMRLSKYVDVK